MIRVKAIAVIVRCSDGALLVAEGDNGSGLRYARPLGGSVEFGELAVDAVAREIREELGCDLVSAEFAGVIENRFELDGTPGHEIVFVYRCALTDTEIYQRELIPVLDVAGLSATWWTPGSNASTLVPQGLRELLTEQIDL